MASSGNQTNERIKLNHLGFYATAPKIAIVPNVSATQFSVISERGASVFHGTLTDAEVWSPASDRVKVADFSDFSDTGTYRIDVEGVSESDEFVISENIHEAINRASLKAFYFNRASTELSEAYAEEWSRPAGHPDTQVRVHSSAASATRPTNSLISSPQGWYDAGDYNKYIVNSGISTYTLLVAYEHFPDLYRVLDTNIPESGDSIPDLLDEILWNLRWMQTMQDPTDGGVYHKLTTLDFEGRLMPHEATAQRYVVQKSTDAALNFAAVMAVAGRVFREYETEFPGFAQRCLDAAVRAWLWAKNNPNNRYIQPEDVETGVYSVPGLNDEFAWAAAELHISLSEDTYYTEFDSYRADPDTPSWGDTMALGYLSLLHHQNDLTRIAEINAIRSAFFGLADSLRQGAENSAYRVSMGSPRAGRGQGDFVWGSNAVALNQSFVLIQAYRHSGESSYLAAALANLDYVLGRNAVGISMVTGFGARSPRDIHHRQSDADSVVEPIPGFIVGGPHSGQQDGCSYASNAPAKSYLDDWCSYSTNEVAINWNAPLVYVSGAMEALY